MKIDSRHSSINTYIIEFEYIHPRLHSYPFQFHYYLYPVLYHHYWHYIPIHGIGN